MASSFSQPEHADGAVISFRDGVRPANPYAAEQAGHLRFAEFDDGITVREFIGRCRHLGGHLTSRATTEGRKVLAAAFDRGLVGIDGVFKDPRRPRAAKYVSEKYGAARPSED